MTSIGVPFAAVRVMGVGWTIRYFEKEGGKIEIEAPVSMVKLKFKLAASDWAATSMRGGGPTAAKSACPSSFPN